MQCNNKKLATDLKTNNKNSETTSSQKKCTNKTIGGKQVVLRKVDTREEIKATMTADKAATTPESLQAKEKPLEPTGIDQRSEQLQERKKTSDSTDTQQEKTNKIMARRT